jgi:hypothetical protein
MIWDIVFWWLVADAIAVAVIVALGPHRREG